MTNKELKVNSLMKSETFNKSENSTSGGLLDVKIDMTKGTKMKARLN